MISAPQQFAARPRRALPAALVPLALLGLLMLLGGCDYPEQGFYELVGVNDRGDAVIAHPFMVEEIVDDTELTIGFRVLLPGSERGSLAEAELTNSTDLSRRGWHLALANGDTRAGDIDIDIDHIDLDTGDGRLEFSGLYRSSEKNAPVSIGGFAAPSSAEGISRVIARLDLPKMPKGYPRVDRYELRPISQASFEQRIGAALKDARRMSALKPSGLASKHVVKVEKGEQKPSRSGGARP
ncbi:hypothetical protein IT575_13685 [bacterium]|nr:hypothetical protein [bacterium]